MENNFANELYSKLKGLDPAEAFTLINQWEDAVKSVRKKYSSVYTYCTGCHKYVKYINVKPERNEDKIITRCPECNMTWHIVRVEE